MTTEWLNFIKDFVAFCEPYTRSFKAAFFETPHV